MINLESIAILRRTYPDASNFKRNKRRELNGSYAWTFDTACVFCGDLYRARVISPTGKIKSRFKNCYRCGKQLKHDGDGSLKGGLLKKLYDQQRENAKLRGEDVHDVVSYVIAKFRHLLRLKKHKTASVVRLKNVLSLGAIPVRCPFLRGSNGQRVALKTPRRIGVRYAGAGRNFAQYRNRSSFNYGWVSIDKIFPERGYVDGNIQWTSLRFNLLKNNASFEELLDLGQAGRILKQRRKYEL